ncbi:hypothetical protein LNV09_07415 [Paucibacter sp. B2R-40]|uniref:hypothetical protein n=1 Tax=Paucibacter sp. B2R-40 TaxID=2893554 RepID=UPI0021E44705|nr:hypothetical protein [Paucibacter sp. B2R-40]MCV2353994.1 hypothetical protein [Paucibacter sp. B2R-40]
MTSSDLAAALVQSLRDKNTGGRRPSGGSPFEFKPPALPASLTQLCLAVAEHLEHGGQIYGLASHCQALCVHPNVSRAFWRLGQLVKSPGVMWLLLADWIDRRNPLPENKNNNKNSDEKVAIVLQPHLQGLDPALIDDAGRLFDRLLGAYSNEGWTPTRLPRHRFANKLANEIDALVRQARREPLP